jgi:hypothetical protein
MLRPSIENSYYHAFLSTVLFPVEVQYGRPRKTADGIFFLSMDY